MNTILYCTVQQVIDAGAGKGDALGFQEGTATTMLVIIFLPEVLLLDLILC